MAHVVSIVCMVAALCAVLAGVCADSGSSLLEFEENEEQVPNGPQNLLVNKLHVHCMLTHILL